MCGRYQLVLPLEDVEALFQLDSEAEPYPPRYNIAPTQPIHVVHTGPKRERALTLMRWGLIPSWAKDPKTLPLMINARSETVVEKPAFRNAIRRRRGLCPATGFYEWKREERGKTPYLFEPVEPMALAAIYETWCGPNGEEMDTVAILTAEAIGAPATIHDRMPLTVPLDAVDEWLDPSNDNGADALGKLARAEYVARPVSRRLSNARNEGAALLTPDPIEPKDDAAEEAPRLL
ncbi:MAG: SOS response-associated peptidase [Devosia sp.]